MKEQKYAEAVKFYSDALRKSPNDHLLYSNRSYAYCILKQFYYALCDADRVIELRPDFVKGYFRKAEVLKQTFQYEDALINYGRALKLDPHNKTVLDNFKNSAQMCNREMHLEKNVPWVGAGCGLITGCAIVVLDRFITRTPSIHHPFVMVFLVIVLSAIGWAIARTVRYYMKLHRKGMIEVPTEMTDDFLLTDPNAAGGDDDEQQNQKKRNRYSKSQARFRLKKGKS